MGRLMKDELFEAQLVRALGYTPYGGAELGECLATAERITRVDPEVWYAEWFATASRLSESARASERDNDPVSARSCYFRASNYFRTAGIFLMAAPVDRRLLEAHHLEVESFRRGVALTDLPPELLHIPFNGGSLPGYFFKANADGRARPTLILTTGYDGSAEELYFANGVAALQRGYNVLAFEGPGQGGVLYEQGIPLRPDWENVVRPVVDYALSRSDVDGSKLALMGLSLGGYLAPRAATMEHRLAACVSDCGPYDLFDVSVSRLPAFLAHHMPDGNPLMLSLTARLLHGVMKKPTKGWALRRNLLVHGISDPMEFFRIASDYTLKGRAKLIQCPTLVCHGEGDSLATSGPLYEALVCDKQSILFKSAEGAGGHCEGAARMTFHQRAFTWLATVLASY